MTNTLELLAISIGCYVIASLVALLGSGERRRRKSNQKYRISNHGKSISGVGLDRYRHYRGGHRRPVRVISLVGKALI